MTTPPEKPIFIALPPLDDRSFIGYLRERGWRVEPDETLPFEVICHGPSDPPHGSGWRLVDAAVCQSEQDLRALFAHLEQERYPLPRT